MPAKAARKAETLKLPTLGPTDNLLALDVSSNAVGWAITRGNDLRDFGVLTPPKSRMEGPDRIDALIDQLTCVFLQYRIAAAVLEWSSGKVAGRLHKAAGLSVLGAAQGAIRERLRTLQCPVYLVTENTWTRSRTKEARARDVAFIYGAYRAFQVAGKDAGLDAADAIGLAMWTWGKVRERELIERGTP